MDQHITHHASRLKLQASSFTPHASRLTRAGPPRWRMRGEGRESPADSTLETDDVPQDGSKWTAKRLHVRDVDSGGRGGRTNPTGLLMGH